MCVCAASSLSQSLTEPIDPPTALTTGSGQLGKMNFEEARFLIVWAQREGNS